MASKPFKTGIPRPTASGRQTPARQFSQESLLSSVTTMEDWSVGDRCYVGGTKPGQIAFIGVTQFASGEWVGVILDEATGKNDGTVDGIRYFQTSENRGLFCRRSKLTKKLLNSPEAPDPSLIAQKLLLRNNRSTGSPIPGSPPPPSLIDGFEESGSPAIPENTANLQIGETVIISGSKRGILRYLGTTEFAKGIWAGVELDSAIGKNDGTVQGKRYFQCRTNFGLFAPLSKVVRDPQSVASALKRRGSIRHRYGGSAESISSLGSIQSSASRRVRLGTSSFTPGGTSASNAFDVSPDLFLQRPGIRTTASPSAATALQDTIKEKEKHIEQLLEERELERQEIAKAAQQAEFAEEELKLLKSDNNELQLKLQAISTTLEELRKEHQGLRDKNDEEHKLCEDLQFRLEEESVSKSELEAKIHELNVRSEALAKNSDESSKIFLESKDREIGALKDQIQDLKKEKQTTENSLKNILTKEEETRETMQKLQMELENMKKIIQTKDEDQKKFKVEDQEKFKMELENFKINQKSKFDEEKTKFETEIFRLQNELEISKKISTDFASQVEILKKEKTELEEKSIKFAGNSEEKNQLLEQKIAEIEKLRKQIEAAEKNGETAEKFLKANQDEISALKSELEANGSELKNAKEKILEAKTQNESLEKQIENLMSSKSAGEIESEKLKFEKTELEGKFLKLNGENENLKKQFEAKIGEFEKLQQQLGDKNEDLKKLQSESEKISDELKSVKKSRADFEAKNAKLNENIQELNASLAASLAQCEQFKLEKADVEKRLLQTSGSSDQLTGLLEQKNAALSALQMRFDKETAEHGRILIAKGEELEKSKTDVGNLNENLNEMKTKHEKLVREFEKLNLQIAERDEKISKNVANFEVLQLEKEKFEQKFNETSLNFEQKSKLLEERIGECEKLQKRIDSMAIENFKLKQERDSLELAQNSNADQSGKIIQKIQAELEDLKKTHDMTCGKLQETNVELNRKKEELDTVQESAAQLQKEFANLQSEFNAEKEKNQTLMAQNAKFEQEIAALLESQEAIANDIVERMTSDLNEANGKINELKNSLEASLASKVEVEKFNAEILAERQRLESLLKESQAQVNAINEKTQQSLFASEAERNRYESQMNEMQKSVTESIELREKISTAHREIQLMTESLQRVEAEKSDFLKELENIRHLESQNSTLKNQLDDLKQRESLLIANFDNERASLQLKLEETETQIAQKKAELDALKAEKSAFHQSNSKIEKLEVEKFELQEKIAELELRLQECSSVGSSSATPSDRGGDLIGNNHENSSDKGGDSVTNNEEYRQQIDFLNSVIIDLQRSKDDLANQLERLRKNPLDGLMDMDDFPSIPDIDPKTGRKPIPPRIYCDICELFDSHETEDCPQQAANDYGDDDDDDDALDMRNSGAGKSLIANKNENNNEEQQQKRHPERRGQQRAFCDRCEMFGHESTHCDKATF